MARIFKAKYFPHGSIMDAVASTNFSFTWRSLLWGQRSVKKRVKMESGIGQEY